MWVAVARDGRKRYLGCKISSPNHTHRTVCHENAPINCNKLSHRLKFSPRRGFLAPFYSICVLEQTWDEIKATTIGGGETMSYHNEGMEHIPYIPPLALHCFSVDISGAHPHFGLPSFHLEPAYLDRVHRSPKLPYGGLHYYPCPGPVSVCEYALEPAFIRKRNERERHRVRCVNEGYARLRERLPREFDDKRLSKVETLRAAIDYIKHLQGLLDANVAGISLEAGHKRPKCQ